MRTLLLTCALAIVSAAPLSAQMSTNPAPPNVAAPELPPAATTVSLAGPCFRFSVLNDGVVAKLAERDVEVTNAISQCGWQFEKQFYATANGPTMLNEWVVLVGGLDQGVVLPSLNWMVGVRTRDGAEFGVGPNISSAGVAQAMAAGVTFHAGVLNIPMNFAVVPSKSGLRVSMLTGFTLRK